MNKNSGFCHTVLFRAPYTKVDQDLLSNYGITSQTKYCIFNVLSLDLSRTFRYEAMMEQMSCHLQKAVETKSTSFDIFLKKCEEMKPSFDDVPDWKS